MAILILLQCVFNLVNSRIDAFRILKHKKIAHGINFGLYAILVGAEIYFFAGMHWSYYGILCLSAFLNRQIFFDIPLNIRRSKDDKTITWDYISRANPPKAIWDRIEISLFGRNGKRMVFIYSVLWLSTIIYLFIKN